MKNAAVILVGSWIVVNILWSGLIYQQTRCNELIQSWVNKDGKLIANISIKPWERTAHNIRFADEMNKITEGARLAFEWDVCGEATMRHPGQS